MPESPKMIPFNVFFSICDDIYTVIFHLSGRVGAHGPERATWCWFQSKR